MKMHHTPWHWAAVAAVLAVALLTLSDAHGQKAGSAAGFEGRPAMAGAQGGLGAMSGPPQGGLGVQSTEDLRLPRPGPGHDTGPTVPRDRGLDRPRSPDQPQPAQLDEVEPRRDRGSVDVAPRDGDESGIRKQQRTRDKVKRAPRSGEERSRE
ncbi:hypothetical protein PE066_11130 [Ramlibacter tataouinensis]|uniref:hypothetical protein n=1 Tax=Ramlibacter tataouinensis TaxID=94132 RepID=UPI0022F3979E|nr:hypothetical protein [Ramlibacter tataouinensis]WBY00037.1 hypothetical protein PE066_11130 [Ramlibacter tataouinensis]